MIMMNDRMPKKIVYARAPVVLTLLAIKYLVIMRKEVEKLIHAQLHHLAAFAQRALCNRSLLILQLHDAILHRTPDAQFVDEHFLSLANAVNAVDGLICHGQSYYPRVHRFDRQRELAYLQ